jgi:hypothetical protein
MGPEARVTLPDKLTLRLGCSFGHDPTPYKFIARAILEIEL